MNVPRMQVRELGDERCSWPRCRDESTIRYLRGSTGTELTADGDVDLCDPHHTEFVACLAALRDRDRPKPVSALAKKLAARREAQASPEP